MADDRCGHKCVTNDRQCFHFYIGVNNTNFTTAILCETDDDAEREGRPCAISSDTRFSRDGMNGASVE